MKIKLDGKDGDVVREFWVKDKDFGLEVSDRFFDTSDGWYSLVGFHIVEV